MKTPAAKVLAFVALSVLSFLVPPIKIIPAAKAAVFLIVVVLSLMAPRIMYLVYDCTILSFLDLRLALQYDE